MYFKPYDRSMMQKLYYDDTKDLLHKKLDRFISTIYVEAIGTASEKKTTVFTYNTTKLGQDKFVKENQFAILLRLKDLFPNCLIEWITQERIKEEKIYDYGNKNASFILIDWF